MNVADLKRKADLGSVVAQSILGIYYLYGHKVGRNYGEAFRLLSAASEAGASRAIVNLAAMYAQGLGTSQDLRKAIDYYRSVAKVEVRAQLELARIYSRGLGVKRDPKAARRHYAAVSATRQSQLEPT
jgi:TPR repeat protein